MTQDEFAALVKRFSAAATAGDGKALADCFTPDGIYYDYIYGPHQGRGSVCEMLEELFHRDAAEYDWTLRDGLQAFVGGDATYTSGTDTYFTDPSPQPGENYNPLAVPAYGLLDLRAGVSRDHWRFQLWGHNVTNTYYWTAAYHQTDADVRYTGMPATYGATFSYRY